MTKQDGEPMFRIPNTKPYAMKSWRHTSPNVQLFSSSSTEADLSQFSVQRVAKSG
jgi:hypothetical protein